MDIFKKLSSNDAFDEPSIVGFFLAAASIVGVDGEIKDNEYELLELLAVNHPDELSRALALGKKIGFRESIVLATELLKNYDQRLSTIANLIDLAMADGSIDTEEKELIEFYGEEFELERRDIELLINSTMLKYDLSVFDE